MTLRLRWPAEFGLLPQGFLERPEHYGQFKCTGSGRQPRSMPI